MQRGGVGRRTRQATLTLSSWGGEGQPRITPRMPADTEHGLWARGGVNAQPRLLL